MIRFCVGGFPGIPADLDFVPVNFSLGCLRDDSPAFLFFRREADSLRSPLTVRSDMVNYAVRTIQVNKLGKERFMREGAVLEDDWGRWMGATLTAPRSVLSHTSAAAAWGFWSLPRQFECVTRAGCGGRAATGACSPFGARASTGM